VPAPVGALVEGDRIKELLIGPTVLDRLAHQLTVASEIAWTKHKRLQVSMCFGVAGISCVILAYASLSSHDKVPRNRGRESQR
jgi:hypothetical protein